VRTRWSSLVCFSGLGPGEVHADGRKVVGISQRRTRRWARFQCAAYLHWDPAALVSLLVPPRPSAEELADAVLELPAPASTAAVRAAFEAALP
jgi:lipoate-protein ligase A